MTKKIFCWTLIGFFVFFGERGMADDPAKYPERPVTLTGAWAAGGDTDLACRAISASIQEFSGQPFIVQAKPGGAGLVALQNLVSAKPDGYLLHLGRPAELTVGPLVEQFPFNMDKEIVPIAQLAVSPVVLAVNTDTPWKTFEELVAAAKKEPKKIQFAVANPTSMGRMAVEKLCLESGIAMTAVPFKGGAPAATAAAGGHIPCFSGTLGETLPHTGSGKLRALLVFADTRAKEYPGIPTAMEKGLSISFGSWQTVMARQGTPEPVLKKLEAWMKAVTENKEYINTIEKIGSQVSYLSGRDFARYWAEEKKWMDVVVTHVGLKKP